MAKHRNCPNCGAPYDVKLSKCPYCNTSYFDMSAIDINNQEPFYLKIRLGNNIFTQLVVPVQCDIEQNCDQIYCYGGKGQELTSIITSRSIGTSIKFEAIENVQNNSLFTVERIYEN